ncbi:hypothetical protein DI09_488p10 [Mitosporidium daphniae]|uniref:DNA replication complex GINS protein PSF3 n=1 Tax=Mitosporidium daphniae TaxID=1485682 RepID=A0A098VPX1_9MICR|nr:uncharacterized protein DI09_488p10 [Mitosporidium daphniae]KGG51020.1 hypothetical protein DI09_488p10 [Mitosporidium daphniae]|eukprot:XP_013237456.1 uncharacterized protein DI09_488p10 [Mitosporidium daphniae]
MKTESQLVKSRFNGDIPASPTYASDQESPMSAIISEILLNGVEKSTILELPWWLASTLLQVNFVDISLPRAFNQRSREALQMGPWATNLCELSPFFYRFSIKLLPVYAIRFLNDLELQIQFHCTSWWFRLDLVFDFRPSCSALKKSSGWL